MERTVQVTQTIDVTVYEAKFTPEFMQGFRDYFYDFETVEDHIQHLAQLHARGIVHEFTEFIEGYGKPADMGIKFKSIDCTTDIE